MLVKRLRNLDKDGTITRTIGVIIKGLVHVCALIFWAFFWGGVPYLDFLGDISIILIEKTYSSNHYREKTIAEALIRQGCCRDWMLKAELEIAFCFICATGLVRIVVRTWFMENDFGAKFLDWLI